MSYKQDGKCPDDGTLRFLLDDPMIVDGQTRRHVEECVICAQRLRQLKFAADAANGVLDMATPSVTPEQTKAAYQQFRVNAASVPAAKTGFWSSWTTPRVARWSAVGAALTLVLVLTMSPLSTVADTITNRWKVERFEAVTIPVDAMPFLQAPIVGELLGQDSDGGWLGLVGTMLADTDLDAEIESHTTTLADAEAQFGDIKTPEYLPAGFSNDPTVFTSADQSETFDVPTATAKRVFGLLGVSDSALPSAETTPTMTFGINVPAGALLAYKSDGGQRILIGQMESPSLDIPDGVDMNKLRDAALKLPGLPNDLVKELKQIDDWENTLIIPVPSGAESKDVKVNGDPGLLITHQLGSALLWEKDGVLYGIIGQTTGAELQAIANSMR